MTAAERLPEPSNPLGIDGLEFVEYATSQPQAFGALLEKLGLRYEETLSLSGDKGTHLFAIEA